MFLIAGWLFVVRSVLSSPPSFICEVASARGMGRSNWIRSVCIEAAARPSTDRDLVNRVNVIDERAREVMVDVIERVARLEAAVFKQGNDADPFSGKWLWPSYRPFDFPRLGYLWGIHWVGQCPSSHMESMDGNWDSQGQWVRLHSWLSFGLVVLITKTG